MITNLRRRKGIGTGQKRSRTEKTAIFAARSFWKDSLTSLSVCLHLLVGAPDRLSQIQLSRSSAAAAGFFEEKFFEAMLYINGRPIHPLISFLVSVAAVAAMIGLGILLLPIIGGIMIFVLFCVAAIAAYGFYYRWRYGDPFKRAQEEMLKRMQQAAGGSAGGRQQTAAPSEEPEVRRGEAKTGIRRTTIIEDAVVVQEVRRRGPNDAKEQG